MQNLGGKIKNIIQKYYTEPAGLASKRRKKLEKNVSNNYEKLANLGYQAGDRQIFLHLGAEIASICKSPDQGPPGEET